MSIINVQYLQGSNHFSNGKVANVFGNVDKLPGIFLLNAGVIVGQAPGKVLKYYLEDKDWQNNKANARKVLNTLTMLASLDVDDSMIRVKRNQKVTLYPMSEYQVPSNLGLHVITNSSDRIYVNEAARKKNKIGFCRDLTQIDYTLVDAEKNAVYDRDTVVKNSLVYTKLYDDNADCWNNVMSPTELKTWFEEWNNQHTCTFTWANVEKSQELISTFGCFFSGDENNFCLASEVAGNANDILTTLLGIKSKVDVSSMYASLVDVDPEQIFTYIRDLSASNKVYSPEDEQN